MNKHLKVEEQISIAEILKDNNKTKFKIYSSILDHITTNHLENELTNEFKIEYIRLLSHYQKNKVCHILYPLRSYLKLKLENTHPQNVSRFVKNIILNLLLLILKKDWGSLMMLLKFIKGDKKK